MFVVAILLLIFALLFGLLCLLMVILRLFPQDIPNNILLNFSDLLVWCVDFCEWVLTVWIGLRIVRFLRCCSEVETEEMIIPQSGFVASVLGWLFNKQITDKCECDKPHTV